MKWNRALWNKCRLLKSHFKIKTCYYEIKKWTEMQQCYYENEYDEIVFYNEFVLFIYLAIYWFSCIYAFHYLFSFSPLLFIYLFIYLAEQKLPDSFSKILIKIFPFFSPDQIPHGCDTPNILLSPLWSPPFHSSMQEMWTNLKSLHLYNLLLS